MPVELTEKQPGDVTTSTQAGTPAAPVNLVTAASAEAPLAPVTAQGGAKPEAPAPVAQPDANAPAQQPPAQQKPRETFVMTQDKLREVKKDEARKALLREAKQAGFNSVEEYRVAVTQALARERGVAAAKEGQQAQQPPAQAKPAEQPAANAPPPARAVPMQSNDQQKVEMMAAAKAKAEKEARELRKQMEAMKGDMVLKSSAAKAGITEDASAEFALFLLRKHADTLTDAELDEFDPDTWFPKLRETRPHLFTNNPIIEHGSTTAGDGAPAAREATTSTGANPAGANATPGQRPPTPPTKTQQQDANTPAQPDALKMSDSEFAEWSQKRGYSRPNGSTSYPTPLPRGGGQG